MNTSGGFAEYISVPSDWAIKCPDGLTTKDAMILGTAGLTAGLAIKKLTKSHSVRDSNVIISGSTGGVGSIAVKLLSMLKSNVTAITNKDKGHDYLKKLGASEIITNNQFLRSIKLPMNKGLYDYAIDVVGGRILSGIIASMRYGGKVIVCGNVSGADFKTTVFPFILRANSLIGIDSAETDDIIRSQVWHHFSTDWKLDGLENICTTISIEDLQTQIDKMLEGKQMGRILVQL